MRRNSLKKETERSVIPVPNRKSGLHSVGCVSFVEGQYGLSTSNINIFPQAESKALAAAWLQAFGLLERFDENGNGSHVSKGNMTEAEVSLTN